MYIPQYQLKNVLKMMSPQKAVLIYGPRRCGKTTLLKELIKQISETTLFVSGEDITVKEYLSSQSIEKLKTFAGDNKVVIIDEAQKIKNIGMNIKLILDHITDIKVLASGSSSFDLARQAGEPLTGRKYTLKLFPLSQMELNQVENHPQTMARLEDRLIFGSYPEVITSSGRQQRTLYLKEIVNSYLYKDILELEGIRHSDKIVRLLQLLVFQIGKEVSQTELGQQLGMSKNTVNRYLDLLEKSFVIFRLKGLSRNPRKEISKNSKYYFLDNGIRNALINNFNPLNLRDDAGALWENYIIVERLKKQEYLKILCNNYFWRTYSQQEIDLVEESSGTLSGYEIKWSKSKTKPPAQWHASYPDAHYQMITKENYLPFITS
ncbi:MAG: ATP-binding protein [Candidatus Omnitrophica bacterium]|nr:ATP-binding protein [Candidatus Omnitrophota bacterium]